VFGLETHDSIDDDRSHIVVVLVCKEVHVAGVGNLSCFRTRRELDDSIGTFK
jgi:hypothetical protein